jgi:hypothetical protein
MYDKQQWSFHWMPISYKSVGSTFDRLQYKIFKDQYLYHKDNYPQQKVSSPSLYIPQHFGFRVTPGSRVARCAMPQIQKIHQAK